MCCVQTPFQSSESLFNTFFCATGFHIRGLKRQLKEKKVGKPLLTQSALSSDEFHEFCDMVTIPPETDVVIN